jgi:hypothetical protein
VREASRRGLSTFLADHEEHGEGFDIQRREGTGGSVVRVICGGCGEATEYAAASDMELPAEQPASRRVSERLLNRDRREGSKPAGAARTPAPPVAGNGPAARRSLEPIAETGSRFLSFPPWLATSLVALLITGGLLLVVLGVTSSDGGSESPVATIGSQFSVAPPVTVPLSPPAAGIRLDRRRFAERVAIGIPSGWRSGVADGAVTVLAGNGRADVQVYFEEGATPQRELVRDSRAFLLERHSGARVVDTGRVNLGGRPATTIRVRYPTGTESAVILIANGFTYLILERLAKPVSPQIRETTEAVVTSFRPV